MQLGHVDQQYHGQDEEVEDEGKGFWCTRQDVEWDGYK